MNQRIKMAAKNKRGVSEIVGYILMIAIVIGISVFVYTWLKSYVPQSALTCPDGVSASVPDVIYNCTSNTLNFSFYNDGTFSFSGYFIHATNDSSQQIAALDLTPFYNGPGTKGGNSIVFSYYNILDPGKEKDVNYNSYALSGTSKPIASGTLKEIEIIPMRYVEYNGKDRVASCTSAKVSVLLTCVP